MSECRERIAKALRDGLRPVNIIAPQSAFAAAETLAPLVEAAIEATITGIIGSNRTDPVMEMHASESWAAALSVLEGKEKQ